MHSKSAQIELFREPNFDSLNVLLGPTGDPPDIIVGCGRRKKASAGSARSLYRSARFNACRTIAETLGARYFILSGRYGLLEPDTVVEPYDLDIGELPEEDQRKWAQDRKSTRLNSSHP